jgi:hypothetical protein
MESEKTKLSCSKLKSFKQVTTITTNSNKSQSYLHCFYTNATSLNNKFDEFIDEINNNHAQIVMVCETWWSEHSAMNVEGYNLFRKDRVISRGGRVCIFL